VLVGVSEKCCFYLYAARASSQCMYVMNNVKRRCKYMLYYVICRYACMLIMYAASARSSSGFRVGYEKC
jgi:hypothetical protein